MSTSTIRRLLVAGTFWLAAATGAQEESLKNWYQVEVIVFTQADIFGDEGYPREPRLDYPRNLTFLNNGERLSPELPPNASRLEQLAALMVPDKFLTRERAKRRDSFVPLEKNRRNLNPHAYTLGRGGDYRVLFHNAWQQEITGRRAAPWVFVSGGQPAAGHRELEGSLRLYRSRFLHIQVDLWLSRFDSPAGATANPPAPGQPATDGIVLPEAPEPPPSPALRRLRMTAPISGAEYSFVDTPAEPVSTGQGVARVDVLDRAERISPSSLTYIDHPRMGMLVLVTPLEEDEKGEE